MINKVILIGRIINDSELRYFKNGNIITILKILTNDIWEGIKDAQIHRVILKGKFLDFTKGMLVFIEGSIRTRKWMGEIKYNYITEIFSNNIKIIKNNYSDLKLENKNNIKNSKSSHDYSETAATINSEIEDSEKTIDHNSETAETEGSDYVDDNYNYDEEGV